MAHTVKFEVPQRDLSHANIEFYVKKDGKAFGKLLISKGAVVWRPRSDKHGKKMGWTRFDQFMQLYGRSVRGG